MTWSISVRALPTISSIRAGWMRPSTRSRSRARFATSRRMGSNPETTTASGELGALLVLKLCDCPPLALELLLFLAKAVVALVDLRDLLIELLILLVEPALVALKLGSTLAVLQLGCLGDF